MESNRNPGLLTVTVGVGLGVLFALLGATGVLNARVGFGLAGVALVVAALVYVFFSRGNAVTKTGYAALIMIIALGLIIPFQIVYSQKQQADAQTTTYTTNLQRGAALFGQYCASCHGYLGQGIKGPKLNGNPVVSKLTNDDLTRIISGGISATGDPSKLAMPAWLNTYGGSLTQDDISYLVALIRSSDPKYLATNNLPSGNGFNYVLGTLTNPTQIAEYHTEQKGGSKPTADTFLDLTKQTAVTILSEDVNSALGPYGWVAQGGSAPNGQQTANIIIKVGTKVTWGNTSTVPHNVFSGSGGTVNNNFPSQAATAVITPNQAATYYSYTFTKAGEYPFFCGIHPYMVGWITVQ
ncbi:MAG: plastocyanin/azurin family copper-binding protein [Ktedonobacterales bacterium]